MPVIKSIEQLRDELRAKEKQLKKIRAKRAKLAKELAAVDRRIAALSGEAAPARAVQRQAGKKTKKVRRARLRATGKPLVAYMKEALAKSKSGLSIKDLVKAVSAAGYQSHSKDFYGIVAKTVLQTDGFKRVKRGVYKLG